MDIYTTKKLETMMENDQTIITATYSLTKDEYFNSMKLYAKQYQKIKIVILSILGFTVVISTLDSEHIFKSSILAFLSIFIYLFAYLVWEKVVEIFKKNLIEAECLVPRTISFTQYGVKSQSSSGNSFIKYSALIKYERDDKLGLLYISKRRFFIIPLHKFNPDILDNLLKNKDIKIKNYHKKG